MKIGTDGVLLGAWAFKSLEEKHPNAPFKILDVGCGTGVISLMMAQRFGNATITGVELESNAYSECLDNFRMSPWNNRLDVRQADFSKWVNEQRPLKFDLIISNPPFFSNGVYSPEASRYTARHEGSLNMENLIANAPKLLTGTGRIAMVLPAEYKGRIQFQAELSGMHIEKICMVKTVSRKEPRRLLCELSMSQSSETSSEQLLTIQDENGMPSDFYRELVGPFYLNF